MNRFISRSPFFSRMASDVQIVMVTIKDHDPSAQTERLANARAGEIFA